MPRPNSDARAPPAYSSRASSFPLYRAADGVRARTFEGELVLLDLRGNTQYALNELGARVWSLATSGADATSITSAVVADYAVDAPQARADVDRILGELIAQGLLIQVASSDPFPAT